MAAPRDEQWARFSELRVRWCLRSQLNVCDIEEFCTFYSALSIRDQEDFNREVDEEVQRERLERLRQARQRLKQTYICLGG
ncbi:protein UL30A [Cercopithecine betaherpesvirus 5]|uniref:Protein UL30A n=1 Tax=Simian cytomegalovirus (strain Colburn) TaxID=50292 RepID=R4NFM4_SCMVC|nr:protein UL30A [Cercopithecine betaherpesvirus 5]AGL39516.1 protein UL30A [Cercopithecine betaherpesvirus 5]AGL39517.1 protein UL30A [Cercopithecine betaherpesvirus 5]